MQFSSLIARGLALALLAVPAQAQQKVPAPRASTSTAKLLSAYHIQGGVTQDLVLPKGLPQRFQVGVLIDGGRQILALDAYDVRTKGFRVLASDGKTLKPLPVPKSITYRGHVVGRPGSAVAASLIDGQLVATILVDGHDLWAIQPASPVDPSYGPKTHIAYATSSILPLPVKCGVQTLVAPPHRHGGNLPGPQAVKLAEVAIDADYDFYSRFGKSTTNVQKQVTTVMNAVDAIYKRDVEITFKITTIIVRTSRVYTSTTNLGTRLGQFRSYWNVNHGTIKRDMAHLFSGVGSFSGVIGVAYLRVVCNLSVAYGTSKAYHRNVATNAGLVAHEMGHNFSAPHCNNYGSDCKIMCSGLGGCGRDISRFGNYIKGVIKAYKLRLTCLSDPGPPALTKISPSSVKAFLGGRVTLTGSKLSGVTSMTIGTTTTTKFQIVSDTQISFDAPPPTQLGPAAVTVRNSNGKSNSVTLSFVATKPPSLLVDRFGYSGLVPLEYKFGSLPKAVYVILVAPKNSSFSFLGYKVLNNFMPLTAGVLNSAGLGSFKASVPTSMKGGVLFSQLAVFSSSQFAGTSNIGGTSFF